MSHFTVLVVGENVERQLQPFHEFECTGVDDEFIARARRRSAVTTALLVDGQWHENGRMGWFGIHLDEDEAKDWPAEFAALLAAVPDHALLTLVDCHI